MNPRAVRLFSVALCLLAVGVLPAQEGAESSDVDSLFESPSQDDRSADSSDSLLEEITQQPPLSFATSVAGRFGYSLGYTPEGFETSDPPVALALAQFSSTMSAHWSMGPALSGSTRVSFAFPAYTVRVSELALDYSFEQAAYIRAGLSRIRWGKSLVYPHADLPNRTDDESGESLANDLLLRVTVPIGIGGAELLSIARAGATSPPQLPSPEELHYGMLLNLAVERLDLDLGVHARGEQPIRVFSGFSTTVLDSVELYAEGVAAFGSPGLSGWSASAGTVLLLFEETTDINIEYFYSADRAQTNVLGNRYPLLAGSSLALNLLVRPPLEGLTMAVQTLHHLSTQTGVVTPVVTQDVAPHLQISGGVLWVYGDPAAGIAVHNPDPESRALSAFVSFTISGEI